MIDENESTVHLGNVGEISHNYSCRKTKVAVVSVDENTFDIAACTETIVSTRITASVLLTQESCSSCCGIAEQIVAALVYRWNLKHKTSYISSIEG